MDKRHWYLYLIAPVIVGLNWLAIVTAGYLAMPAARDSSGCVTRSLGESLMLAIPHGIRATVIALVLTVLVVRLLKTDDNSTR